MLIKQLHTPNLTAVECDTTIMLYVSIAVKHESTWQAKMMRGDWFPVSRLYARAFMLVIPAFERQSCWELGMHILHMLAKNNYAPAILTMYRFFAGRKLENNNNNTTTQRFVTAKFNELVSRNDANACTWKAAEVWDPEHPEKTIAYLDRAMAGYKKNPQQYEVEPFYHPASEDNNNSQGGKSLPVWANLLSGISEVKEMLLGLVVRKETSEYALRRRAMLERLQALDKKRPRTPLWTSEAVYRFHRGTALLCLRKENEANAGIGELLIAADELDYEKGHCMLANAMEVEADKIKAILQMDGVKDEAGSVGGFLYALQDLYYEPGEEARPSDLMRLLYDEAELRFKRAAGGGDIKAVAFLERLCQNRMADTELSKTERKAYRLAAKEWAEMAGPYRSGTVYERQREQKQKKPTSILHGLSTVHELKKPEKKQKKTVSILD